MLKDLLDKLLSFQRHSFESGQKLKKAMKSILEGLLKNQEVGRSDYLNLGYGLLSGKLLSISSKVVDELAFGLLHAAANPGSNDSPLSTEDAEASYGFVQQGLSGKDIGTCTACLKFMVALTQQSKAVVDAMLHNFDFIEAVWKKCQLYEKMQQTQAYSLACQALKNLITHNSAYQFTMERIKTICLFFKVRSVFHRFFFVVLTAQCVCLQKVDTELPDFLFFRRV